MADVVVEDAIVERPVVAAHTQDTVEVPSVVISLPPLPACAGRVAAATVPATKAVVARTVELSPIVAVGAAGVPVNVGLARFAFSANPLATNAVVAMLTVESPKV